MDGSDLPRPAVRTACPYCGVGCGVLATPDRAGGMRVEGDPDHPANFGRLCSKGSALAETVGVQDRLLTPQIDGKQTDWDTALDLVADKFRTTIAQHGPDSVAFYVSGQLLTEDYYLANKLMKGFIGSANIDTNSRLCMASSVAGHKRAFGTDTVPGLYEDLELADLIVLTGSNLAWCHPVLFQRIAAAKAARPEMKVVVIDPRRTATCDLADLFLPIAPGGDVALFNGLLSHLAEQDQIDEGFVTAHVTGFEAALTAAQACPTASTGLEANDLAEFFALWAASPKVVTVYSQGVNQSVSGTDKVNAIINCHLATGRIGKPGMGPFSVTGQPNAMGGREVGGLANTLACHLELENPEHRAAVGAFWDAPVALPAAAGLKAVDMFKAVAEGQIKAIWIICTNPAVSMPDADAVRDAIAGCDFTVVSDMFATTDTARLADVLLPATGWGEKDGTVTNSERCITRQRNIIPAPGAARDDWAILADVGRRMGWSRAFDYANPAEVFREYAALSGVAAGFGRDFDISGLSDLSDADYDTLGPTRWPVTSKRNGGRFFGDGQFFTPDGKARMLALSDIAPAATPGPRFPFRLNTGRVRDQWHTMTRTAKAARLARHIAEPFVEIHPSDAQRQGLEPACIARLTAPNGANVLLRTLITDRVRPGQVFVPIHWTSQTASAARIDALVPGVTDPISGQPESKAAIAQVLPWQAAWYGFAVSAAPMRLDCAYWALAATEGGWRAELAGDTAPSDWSAAARQMFGLDDTVQVAMVSDPARGSARIAFYDGHQMIAALFVSPTPVAVSRNFLAGSLGNEPGPGLLSGYPGADQPDPGTTICACYNVGVNTIISAIENQNLLSVEAIGAALSAGTNCGSCLPELRALLGRTVQTRVAAE